MHHGKLSFLLTAAGTLAIMASGIALATPQPVKAQCGSQASSCKNCHEVQGKKPVNSDGTGWHQSHAFGDFCYICHGGNNQATDETAAHAGMVSPLSDVKAACAQCHPNDLQGRAEVYARKLGVQVGAASSSPAAATPASAATAATPTPAPVPAVSEPAAPSSGKASLVDYVQRYDQNALGQNPTNWGNIVLWIMIAAMVVGGGGLVATREGLISVSFKDTKPLAGEYPPDVVDMVPDIARLKPGARQSLQRMLKKTGAAGELLSAVGKLSHDEQD